MARARRGTRRSDSPPSSSTAEPPVRLLLGDCLEVLPTLPDETIDAVVCDPPYGIEFMGKDWDKFIPHDEVEMSPRWANAKRADPAAANWGDGEGKFGRLPNYGGRRSSYQCQNCGKRDAFRNPHKCDETGDADWRQVPSYAGASPDVLAFERFSEAWAAEAYRVLKPGGHLLAFGAPRMYHRLAAGIEDAGFEIRDSLDWIYGSGFPKSLDVGKAIDAKLGATADREVVGEKQVSRVLKDSGDLVGGDVRAGAVEVTAAATAEAAEWQGWGTALKPAHEPIVLARKPLAGTVAENVLAHRTGALNIDGARPAGEPGTRAVERPKGPTGGATSFGKSATRREPVEGGRWPANIMVSHLPECQGSGPNHTDVLCAPGCPVAEMNEMSGIWPERTTVRRNLADGEKPDTGRAGQDLTTYRLPKQRGDDLTYDGGGAARFFYVFKPRTRERIGGTIRNLHPTVKPLELMRYLVRLVTPPGGVVLDPFLGSGTTGCAAVLEGLRFIGVERDPESYETAVARVGDYAHASGLPRPSRG